MDSLLPGGWPEVMVRNRALAIEARDILAKALDQPPPCPDDMLGSMATLPLPLLSRELGEGFGDDDPLHKRLRAEYHIEVPLFSWSNPPGRFCRVSAQLYNSVEQYHKLADALRAELKR
jgi:isopenicillin-N epimerase